MPTYSTLDAWLAHLETAHPVGIDMGLTRIGRVKDALGHHASRQVIGGGRPGAATDRAKGAIVEGLDAALGGVPRFPQSSEGAFIEVWLESIAR